MRALTGSIRLFILVFPALLLALWGALYVAACFEALLAPGSPAFARLSTPGGRLTVRAEAYTVNLWDASARVRGLSVRDPGGRLLASASDVRARTYGGWDFSQGFEVDASRGYVRLLREKGGRFEIQRFLPPQPEEPAPRSPFAVRLTGFEVDYLDLSGAQPFARRGRVESADVRGGAVDTVGTVALRLEREGFIRGRFRQLEGLGTDFEGEVDLRALGPVWAHLRTTPELRGQAWTRDFQIDDAAIRGPLTVRFPAKGDWSLTTRAVVAGRGVRVAGVSVESGTFGGLITERGAAGVLDGVVGGTRAQWDGAALWSPRLAVQGRLVASASSPAALPEPVRRLLPRQATFSGGRYEGTVRWTDGQPAGFDGRLVAAAVRIAGEEFRSVDTRLAVWGSRVRASDLRTVWNGIPARGWIDLDGETGRLSGAADAASVPLARVADKFGIEGLIGSGSVRAVLEGTTGAPRVAFLATASGAFRAGEDLRPTFDEAVVRGAWQEGQLRLERAWARTSLGEVAVRGRVLPDQDRIDLEVDAADIPARRLQPEARGWLAFRGRLTGPLRDPQLAGTARGLDLAYGDISVSAAAGRLTVDRRRVRLEALEAVRGTGIVEGSVELGFAKQDLSGVLTARQVQIADYAGDDYLGLLTVDRLDLGGTLQKPSLTGSASMERAFANGVRVDGVRGDFEYRDGEVRLRDLVALAGDGRITGSGTYDVANQTGGISLAVENVDLDKLLDPIEGKVRLGGRLTGTARATRDAQGQWAGEGAGRLATLTVNGSEVGNGLWNAQLSGRRVTGDLQAGTSERFAQITGIQVDLDAETLAADVNLFNLSVSELNQRYGQFLPDFEPEVRRRLDRAQGNLTVGAKVAGSWTNPDVFLETLEIGDLSAGSGALGRIGRLLPTSEPGAEPQAERRDRVWTIRDLAWVSEGGVVSLSGTFDERGPVGLSLDAANLDLSILQRIDANWAGYAGQLRSATVRWEGTLAEPDVRASLDAQRLTLFGNGDPSAGVDLLLPDVRFRNVLPGTGDDWSGGLEISAGKVNYREISADVRARLPLTTDGVDVAKLPLVGRLTVPVRSLEDLARYAPWIDRARSEGTLGGQFDLAGTLDAPDLVGAIEAKASRFATTGARTALKDVQAALAWNRGEVSASVAATQETGGRVDGRVAATLQPVRELLRKSGTVLRTEVLATPLEGSLTVDNLVVKGEAIGNGRFRDFRAGGELQVGGTVQSPLITGTLAARGLDIEVPTEFGEAGPAPAMVVEPRFNVEVLLQNAAHIRAPTTDLFVRGGGRFQGTLANPNLQATLAVERGTVRLPNARITVEPGGELRLSYGASLGQEPTARLDVDLEGRTAVTAPGTAGLAERYSVLLNIRGNLLETGALALSATSDPPGLSQDRILALLGQTQLIESLAGNVASGFFGAGLQSALTGFALPVVFDPIGQRLAASLGLDFVTLEYNPFDLATVTVAKSLGRGFVVQGRSQLGEPAPGRRRTFDLRLTYRPPAARGTLARFSFSAGLDQDRPWKLSVDYGVRFGNLPRDGTSRVTILSGPLPPVVRDRRER